MALQAANIYLYTYGYIDGTIFKLCRMDEYISLQHLFCGRTHFLSVFKTRLKSSTMLKWVADRGMQYLYTLVCISVSTFNHTNVPSTLHFGLQYTKQQLLVLFEGIGHRFITHTHDI